MILISILPLAMGIFIASQTAINSRLSHYTHWSLVTSMVSFAVGSVFLAILTLLSGKSLAINPILVLTNPWWIWVGGLTAAFALTINILLFDHRGSIEATLYPVVGQIIMSLVIDQFGWFDSKKELMNPGRFLGAVLLIIGLLIFINLWALINEHKIAKSSPKKSDHRGALLWQLLGVSAGFALAIQNAVNAKLGSTLKSPPHAALVSFLISFIVLLITNLAQGRHLISILKTAKARSQTRQWWIWCGGLLGSSYVALSSVLVPYLGTGQVVIVALFGQLVFSVLIQQFGWFESPRYPVSRTQLLGSAIMFAGIALIKVA